MFHDNSIETSHSAGYMPYAASYCSKYFQTKFDNTFAWYNRWTNCDQRFIKICAGHLGARFCFLLLYLSGIVLTIATLCMSLITFIGQITGQCIAKIFAQNTEYLLQRIGKSSTICQKAITIVGNTFWCSLCMFYPIPKPAKPTHSSDHDKQNRTAQQTTAFKPNPPFVSLTEILPRLQSQGMP